MFTFEKKFKKFRDNEDGATTVEWVMLASLVTMVGLASTGVLERGFLALAGTVQSELRGDPVEQAAGLTYSDGFDHGSTGWTGSGVTEVAGVGNVLGPLGGTGGYETISRTFDVHPDADHVDFEFDLLSMDSLDAGDEGVVYINGQEVGRVVIDHQESATFVASDDLEARGITIRAETIDDNVDLGGTERWTDTRTSVRIRVDRPEDGSDFSNVTFGLGSEADQSTGDESYAIDNFNASGLNDPTTENASG